MKYWVIFLCVFLHMVGASAYGVEREIEGERLLSIESLRVDSRVDGHVALTDLEIVFANISNEPLGDELVLLLSDYQFVDRLELKVDGEVLEDLRGIETDEDNRLIVSIDLIQAGKSGQISLSIEQTLESWGSISTYRMPLRLGRHVDSFDFALTLSSTTRQPRIIQGLPDDLDFVTVGESSQLRWSEMNMEMDRQIRVDLRDRGPRAYSVVSKNARASAEHF